MRIINIFISCRTCGQISKRGEKRREQAKDDEVEDVFLTGEAVTVLAIVNEENLEMRGS
jgi:hypothetical protein